jgi:all-trans-retinol 13,14-reductase
MKQSVVSYKRHDFAGPWDAVVIGSGIGGLATAAILAKEGKRVLVLEQHYTAGGFTHVFRRPNYEWDVGLHYVGEVMRENSTLRRLFDYVSDGELEWADMGEVYDKICFGEEVYEFRKGTENFKAELKRRFPATEDHQAIDEYVDLVFQAVRGGQKYFMEKAMPPMLGKLTGRFLRKKFMSFAERSTLSVLRELTSNERLIGVLTGQWGDYGLPPGESSFAMHAMVARHYFSGGAYPVGGSGAILEHIAPVIERAGGQIAVNAEVDEVIIENNHAVGVRMADRREIFADIVISGAGYMNTIANLLPDDVVRRHDMDTELEQVEPSASHICLYLGFQKTAEELDLPKANYWLYPESDDHDKNVEEFLANPDETELPVTYISFPSAKDPDWQRRYPGTATVEIITVAPYDWFSEWEGTRWKKRGEEYEALKEKLTERMLAKLFAVEPQLEGLVDHCELSTPLSTQHFANYATGEIYGLSHTPERFDKRFLRAHTPVHNLYLTGQDIATCGIGGALSAAMITAAAALKQNIPGKIFKGS